MAKRVGGAQRKREVIEGAVTLFDARGYHETSMEAIAEHVGLRKPSLYYYFPSKERLLVHIHQEMLQVLIEGHQVRVDEGALTPSEMLRAMMCDIVGLMESHPGRLRIFFENYRQLPDDVRDTISAQRDRYRGMVVDVLRRGVDQGEFVDLDAHLISLAVLGMCNWTYQWFQVSGPASAHDVADLYWRMVLGGISAPGDALSTSPESG